MKDLIDKYIQAHKLSWADSTLRSEKSRLYAISDILNGDAESLWQELKQRGMKPYASLTTWIRTCHFFNWLIENEHDYHTQRNHYSDFRKRNKRLFKYCYQRRLPTMHYAQAKRLIDGLSDSRVRETASLLLMSGLRASEAHKIQGETVVGKGNRPRLLSLPKGAKRTKISYWKLYSVLKRETGLKPHDLRKLFLSRVVELGASPFELCEIAGWSDVKTAASYIKISDGRIKELIKKAQE